MKFNANKLKELSRPLSTAEKDEIEFRNDNREWLAVSKRLALKIHRILREKGLSQYELAVKMGVSPAQVTKILSGKENLGIKTICKIEQALGVSLIEIPMPESRESFELSFQTSIKTQQPLKYVRKVTFTPIVSNNILA